MIYILTIVSLIGLLFIYPSAAYSGADAFASVVQGLPVQADKNMQDFLKGLAVKINAHEPQFSTSVKLFVTYSPPTLWHVYAISPNNNADPDQKRAFELTHEALSQIKAPANKPFGIVIIFDSNSAKSFFKKDSEGNIDYGPYMALVQRKIKSNWRLTKDPEKYARAAVLFHVNQNGSVGKPQIDKSSDISDYDQQAVETVNQSAPFLPLPIKEGIDIVITFDYEPQLKSNKLTDEIFTMNLTYPEIIDCNHVNLQSAIQNFSH